MVLDAGKTKAAHAASEAAEPRVASEMTGVRATSVSGSSGAAHAAHSGGKVDEGAAAKGKGRAKYVVPVLASCLGLLVAALLMMPMLKMEPRNVPVAILSLDEGVTVDGTYVNAGDLLLENLVGEDAVDEGQADDGQSGEQDDDQELPEGLSLFGTAADEGGEDDGNDGANDASSDESSSSSGYVSSDAVAWMVAESQEELDELFSSGECYAALTVPAGFSKYIVANAGRTALGSQLVERLPELADAATALESGASALATGAGTLASGVSSLTGGVDALDKGAGALPFAASSAEQGAEALAEGLSKLSSLSGSLETGASQMKEGVDSVEKLLALALAELQKENPDQGAVDDYLEKAAELSSSLGEGADQIVAGAAGLSSGLSASQQGADALTSGLGKLSGGAEQLASGVGSLASGASQLEAGTSALASGAGALSSGSGALADGLAQAGDALDALPSASDEELAIQLVINQGKNPMVSSSLGSAISSMGSSSGIAFDITYENPLPEGMSMGFTHMILMMLTYLSSYITAVVISNTFKLKKGGARQMFASIGVQVGYAALCALLVGFCGAGVIVWITGASIDLTSLALFVALSSFAFQMIVLGSLDLFGMAGMVVPIGILVIGMGTAYLPTEFLPAFWQNWVYPWDPLRFMADGFRGIMYMGQGFWNPSSPALLVVAAIGAALIGVKAVLCHFEHARPRRFETEG